MVLTIEGIRALRKMVKKNEGVPAGTNEMLKFYIANKTETVKKLKDELRHDSMFLYEAMNLARAIGNRKQKKERI